jgi:stress-induced morphogen
MGKNKEHRSQPVKANQKDGAGKIMAMNPGEIERLITEAIPDAVVRIEDLRGDGDHYAAHVESRTFQGRSRVQQHQMVYQALRGRMGEQLHALALRTTIPADN